jgi:two-component system CheB/CheR fusion protein
VEDEAGRPLPEQQTPLARAARGESFSLQFTLRDETDRRRWFEAQGEPVRVDGAVRWGVVVIRNITERSLRRLQDEFVANVSHGLQTPITVIRASLGLLASGGAASLGAEERGLLASARQHVEQLRVQIEDLLTANQMRAGVVRLERAPLDLRDLAIATLESLRVLFEEKQQPVTVDLPEPLPTSADAQRMEQALVNLLANAQRHTPEGTRITLAGAREGDVVRLTVRDTGPGIPEESLEAIFQPFRRLGGRSHGSGLGLGIARALVTLHGGRLWAERPADGGVAFHIALPIGEEEDVV